MVAEAKEDDDRIVEVESPDNHSAVQDKSPNLLARISLAVIYSLEQFFYKLGTSIANHPWIYIASCLILPILCGIGFLGFNPEKRPDKLWIPWNSDFAKNADWLRDNFPSPIRFHYAIITADNVLEPKIMRMLQDLHENVAALKTKESFQWKDVCFKLPVTKLYRRRRRKANMTFSTGPTLFPTDVVSEETEIEMITSRGNSDKSQLYDDPSFVIGHEAYCDILTSFDEACWESSIAEAWGYDKDAINGIIKEDILNVVNSRELSPIFGRPVNYVPELGSTKRGSTGDIVSAQAIMVRWYAKINQTALRNGDIEHDIGTGQQVDRINLEWESQLSNLLHSYSLPEGVNLYYNVARSFGDVSDATIWGDASVLALGFSIVFMYVIFMLGGCNLVEQRPYLSLAGLSCVALAIGVSYGISSAFGIIYGPIHNLLPFLIMGIGIDDMFVIMQCWNNLSPIEMTLPLPQRMGLTLQHAGVSITVTSITDVVAFAIGATTVIPALRSFCIYAALGIMATYIFQTTFFVSWFVLDQRRVESHRNAFLFCYSHENFVPNRCSERNYAQLCFDNLYSKFLSRNVSKVLVLVVTFLTLGINIWGNTLLRQEFSPIFFLPQDSYLFKYFMARDKYFPDRGDEAFVLMNNVSFPDNLKKLDNLNTKLKELPHVREFDSWYSEFKEYVNYNIKKELPTNKYHNLTESEFHSYLGRFLYSPVGSRFRGRMKINGNLTCGSPSPQLLISSISFTFKLFKGPEEHIPAMHEIKALVASSGLSTKSSDAFVWSFVFAGWETDEIITTELYRNMSLAMLCVFITTLILIANLQTCLMVLICVVFTLVNVAGSMHFWGLTIDTVSCVDLVLAIGLSVDYSAHIGHAFMTCDGNRDERSRQALVNIGPAVLNGGFSTFLAFLLLANSKSHVFITFFKIFFLVVIYGLFHGLIFLPVMLSLLGPPAYPSRIKTSSSLDEEEDTSENVQLNTIAAEDGHELISDEPLT